MNPSQGNGSNVPGVKPGVIASGNSDGNPGVTGNGNLGVVGGTTVIASGSGAGVGVVGGANVGMGIGGSNGGVPNATPVGMTRSPQLAQPLATATPVDRTPTGGRNGDIILTPTPANDRKRPKPALIVGIALIILAVVLGIIAVVMVVSNNSKNSGQSNYNATGAIDDFISYLSTGNVATGNIQENCGDEVCYIWKVIYDEVEGKEAYFKELDRLYNKFRENIPENTNEAVVAAVSNLAYDYVAMKLYGEINEQTGEEILAEYLSVGSAGVMEQVNAAYLDMANSENSFAQTYAEDKINEMRATVELLDIYQSEGCVNEGGEDTECIDNLVFTDEMNELLNTRIDAGSDANTLLQVMGERLLNTSYAMYDVLTTGGKQNEGELE